MQKLLSWAKRHVRNAMSRYRPARDFDYAILSTIVSPGDVVFDIGANRGEMAVHQLSIFAGMAGKVFAFEPVPKTYLELCQWNQDNIAERATVYPFPFGLADSTGILEMIVDYNRDTWASLGGISQGQKVPCYFTTVDSVCDMLGIMPNVMKIDVEGAELLVLKGATKTLASRPVLFMEVFAPWERTMGYGPWDVFSLLDGYRFLFQCPEGLIEHIPTQDSPCPDEYQHGYNVVAYHEKLPGLDALRPGRKIPPMGKAPCLNV